MTRKASEIAARPPSGRASVTRSEITDEELPVSDEADVAKLIALFRLLDKWDREVGHHAKIV